MIYCEFTRDLRNRTDRLRDSGSEGRQIALCQIGQAATPQTACDKRHHCRRGRGQLLRSHLGVCFSVLVCTEPKLNEMNLANNRLQATAHNLSLCDGYSSLHHLFLQPVGRRLNRDVGT